MELADVIPQPEAGVSLRRARVTSVAGRMLTVDMGGGITIPSLDDCNPLPGQWVQIIGEGSSMMAIGALSGAYRQAALTVTASNTATVTGILNGVSTAVSKAGAYATTAGDVLPLLWSADGSKVWALGPGGVPYVPPPEAPPPSGGGGGGTVTTGTATYAATWSGYITHRGTWAPGIVYVDFRAGFFYGSGRFRELQGRTITGFRVNLTRASGSGSFSAHGHPHASPPSGSPTLGYAAGTLSANGWVSLPLGLASYLIAGSGTGGLTFGGGNDAVQGLPYGTLQFDWRK